MVRKLSLICAVAGVLLFPITTFAGEGGDHDGHDQRHSERHDHDQDHWRDHDHDRPVVELDYSAHPSGQAELARVAGEVAALDGVRTVAVVHRTGSLRVGDLAVVTAVGAAHRAEAFTACRRLIDDVKARVPIWKHQLFADGSAEWVGSC